MKINHITFTDNTTEEHKLLLVIAALRNDKKLIDELQNSSNSQLPEQANDANFLSDTFKKLGSVVIICNPDHSTT